MEQNEFLRSRYPGVSFCCSASLNLLKMHLKTATLPSSSPSHHFSSKNGRFERKRCLPIGARRFFEFFFFFLQNANPTPFLAVVIVIVISEDVLVEARIYLQPFCYSVESKQQNEYLILDSRIMCRAHFDLNKVGCACYW